MKTPILRLIWWTNQDDCHQVTAEQIASLPRYLQEVFASRMGRNGRGRLWVHCRQFDDDRIAVQPWPKTELADELADDYGGIVFEVTDLESVQQLPGILTDMALNPL